MHTMKGKSKMADYWYTNVEVEGDWMDIDQFQHACFVDISNAVDFDLNAIIPMPSCLHLRKGSTKSNVSVANSWDALWKFGGRSDR
jgi:hypothetical protein